MPTLEQFRRRAHEIADSVAEVAEEFRSRLQKVLRRPEDPGWRADSIELDFQIAVQAEAGVVVARCPFTGCRELASADGGEWW
jgi:hypothetical protein